MVTSDSLASDLDVTGQSARVAIDMLCAAGILEQRSAGRRNRVFAAVDVLKVFNDITDGIGL